MAPNRTGQRIATPSVHTQRAYAVRGTNALKLDMDILPIYSQLQRACNHLHMLARNFKRLLRMKPINGP